MPLPKGFRLEPDVRTGAVAGGPQKIGYSSGTSNPPNGGQITDVDNPEPNDVTSLPKGFTLEQPSIAGLNGSLPAQPKAPVPSALQGPRSVLRNFASAGADVALPLGDAGIGALKGIGSDASGFNSAVGDIPYLGKFLTPGATPEAAAELKKLVVPSNTAQSVGKGLEQVGEFLLPGLGEEAATAKLGKLAPLGRIAYSGLTSGLVNKLQGGGLGTGAAAGGVAGGVGEGLKALAPAVAESAMGVRKLDRAYGKTPGRGILDETTGVSPTAVADSARTKLMDLGSQTKALTDQWGRAFGPTVSLNPARSAVDDAVSRATQRNAGKEVGQLRPIRDFLSRRFDTGQPIPADVFAPQPLVTPSQGIDLRRGLNDEFINNWNPEVIPGVTGTARNAYRALTDELHSTVPGLRELDSRVSSLVPVAKRAESKALNAPLAQRLAGRLTAHTGALTGAVGGGFYGYNKGGLPAAIRDAAIGFLLPEVVGSPTAQMIAARSFNSAAPAAAGRLLTGGLIQSTRKPPK